MISKKVIYKKQLLRKKMLSMVVFGIIFLISTIAYYFVNTSKAQNILCLAVSVMDKEGNIELANYELKVPQENEGYTTAMELVQNGFAINKYTIVNEDEFIKLKELYEEKKVNESKEKQNEIEENIKREIENLIKYEEENKETAEITDENNDKINLTEQQIENKKIYLIADYDYKEEKDKRLYNKKIYYTGTNNYITISGYMPQNSEISVKEVEKADVENKIKDSFKDEQKDLNLSIAYDIKIMVDGKEYEPEDFDKNVKVLITGIDGKTINVWHVKNDSTVEKIEPYLENNDIEFETNSFSIYGVEVFEENVETKSENDEANVNQNNPLVNNDTEDDNRIENIKKEAPVLRSSDTNTLEIDDYDSDYYYYRGKSYTDNLSGTDSNTYTDSNLVKVTINYHSYALADANNDAMKGKISLATNERQTVFRHIRCLPVQSNGKVTIELMDNPFMDKPTGYGFGGWTSSDGTITTNSYTKAQTMSVTTSTDVTVNVYTNWATATVIYLNGASGNDNNNGLTAANAVKTWTSAVAKLSSSNDRERNIIVLCGNMYDGINYQGGASSSSTTNSNYSSASNSKALTITSLYNHTDYRNQATLNLSSNATRGTFTIYKDFQMNHVKINASGYTVNNSNSTSISTNYPRLFGRCNNVRIGRGMTLGATGDEAATFTAVVGGDPTSSNTDRNAAYRLVVESGKYFTILGYNYYYGDYSGANTYSYDGTIYYTLGSDVDRADGHESNDNLSIYFRTTINTGSGYNGNTNNEKAFLIDIKSGEFGVDYFDVNGESESRNGYTAGVYVGGLTTGASDGTTDRADRICLVEGGEICNIIGGLKMYTSYTAYAKTRIYVKGGEVRNIVGGAGVSETRGDRMIQVTGGKILCSVSGGSNGVYGGSGDGQIIDCDTLVYIGGTAQIGDTDTITTTLYGVQGGCVLGAGNGAQGVTGCGQVDNSHIVINDDAHILNSVFGGGNYGVVGSSNGSSATAKIDIFGGTIDKNVYGGANQNNINGSTTINVKGGQIKGAVYGGSNSSGNIKTTATVNVTGGTLGTSGNTNPVLFGGGKGLATNVIGNATVNISDEDGNVNIYGSAYGGSEQGVIGNATTSTSYTRSTSITSGNQYIISTGTPGGYNTAYAMTPSGTEFTSTAISTSGIPSTSIQWIITSYGGGYSIKNAETGKYIAYSNGLVLQDNPFAWTFSNNRFSYRGNRTYYIRYYYGDWISSTSTNGATLYLLTFSITRNPSGTASTFVNITDDMTTSNKKVNIVGNVFAGGRGTTSVAAMVTDDSTITVDGCNLPSVNIFGGNDINGTTDGDILVKIGEHYSSRVANVYGGGNEDDTGTEADSVRVRLYSNANVTNAFNGGKSADLVSSSATDTTRQIFLQGGHADNVFGGSDTNGTVTVSNVIIQGGTATKVYGGNNLGGQTTTSHVNMSAGTVTEVYGGGFQAATTTSNVDLTGGTITNAFGGGNAANVTTSNITLNGATVTEDIYGGSNSSGTVNTSNVTITSGSVRDVYGGNNQNGNTVNATVNINSQTRDVYGGGNRAQTTGNTTVNVTSTVRNVYGGGNEASTSGNTNLYLHNAIVTGAAYGGGNGQNAVVGGNSTTKVDGTTVVNGDLFGGGNAAPNGNQTNNNSLVTTLIKGGWIKGDVYGAANTSVVYGDTVVKIGTNAVNDSTMTEGDITIGDSSVHDPINTDQPLKGTVFGGGKSNSAGSANYDFTFESVTGDATLDIDATGYDSGTGTHTFNILRSIFGSGNAAKISGDGIVTVKNYGSRGSGGAADVIKTNISIQRATQVTLDNCHMYLIGTTDTTNEIATAVYTFNRIEDLILKNNTVLYLASGVNIVAKLQSLDSSGAKETVTISPTTGPTTSVDNRIYLSQGRTIILKTEAGTDGEVLGMAYVGMFTGTTNREFGIYGDNYTQGATITQQVDEIFTRNSYVQGKHYTNPAHNINQDGYFTKFNVDDKVDYQIIRPTPDDATYYQWIMGKASTDIYYEDIELIATKYSTTGTYVLSLAGLSYPNMIIDVVDIDCSHLANGVSLNDPDTIPNIAATGADANTKYGLTMTAGNSGWQTRGTTYFLHNQTHQEEPAGRLQYLSDNSTTTPSFSLYLAHSKNISTTTNLGTVTIHLTAKYYEGIYSEQKTKNVYIVIKLTTNNQITGTDYYEGAITPGKQYNMFPSTTTTITKESSFSAYYSLYVDNYSTAQYYQGFSGYYYHTIETSCVFPANTKITLIDRSASTPKYYYYIISAADAQANKKVFRFTDFFAMDSEQEHYSADGSYYTYDANNNIDLLYEEYIIHVDFEDTTLSNSLVDQNIVVQLRDVYDSTIRVTVNNALYPMLFSVYDNKDATKTLTLTTDKNVIYMGELVALDIDTVYEFNKTANNDIVFDTTHIENALGVRISISVGNNMLTTSQLEGIYITYNNENYFPRADGTFRIKIADAVANVLAHMTLNTTHGKLATGTYTITAQSFGSIDGTYFSTAIASDSKNIQVVSNSYGFAVNLDNNSVLIDKATGKTENNNNNLAFTIEYSGSIPSPKIVVSLYRRKYDTETSREYELVDLQNYVTNTLTVSDATLKEYLVTNQVTASQNMTLVLKNTGLTSGTYKVRFTLYDGTVKICDMDKPIIIK